MIPSIDEVKQIQAKYELRDVHVVYLSRVGFRIAHTDEERLLLPDLHVCGLHCWLDELGFPPLDPGFYLAMPNEPEAYTPWEFDPLRRYVG